ncbi:GDSL-type esterase/lipase family protein [Celerinatantimonas yamalensis]|uniref:GDSL-type esterase/lipase family protein n=1 Tax=Celerinatantimonas yamalensis TaxID=559956 RepID=A0ABW9G5J3_9GAMM
MKNIYMKSAVALCVLGILSGCGMNQAKRSANAAHKIAIENHQGLLIEGNVSAALMQFPAVVTVVDKQGKMATTSTDLHGNYQINVQGMTAPLVISAKEQGRQCHDESQQMGICLASLYFPSSGHMSQSARVNLNPLSDAITSHVAKTAGFAGPQALVDAKTSAKLSKTSYQQAIASIHAVFGKALVAFNLPKQFNPIDSAAKWQPQASKFYSMMWVNRSYQSSKGVPSETVLSDHYFRPLGVKNRDGQQLPVDLSVSYKKQQRVNDAKYRIFIVGDSTASIYPAFRYPRMGWGQVFQQQFNPSDVQVIDGAQSGRSSRLYRNEGWFRYLSSMMRPGDYLFIQMGHNDEKCNGAKASRGPIDVANLCTYPNTANGKMQYPKDQPNMSFEKSLEFYIDYAKAHQVTPVLLTPTTRFKNAHGRTQTPIAYGHLTKNNSNSGYAFVGNYSQTIKDTARKNGVALLDVETGTIVKANQLGNANWKKYWLAVDPNVYPFYKNKTGRIDKPDSTHFQQRGAQMVADIVASNIAANAKLANLAKYLVKSQ